MRDAIDLKVIIKKQPENIDFSLEILEVDTLFICAERTEQAVPFLKALEQNWCTDKQKLGILVGPEGGFSEEELRYFSAMSISEDGEINQRGGDKKSTTVLNSRKVVLVSLGSNILRAETAGIFGLSCAAAFYESKHNTDTTAPPQHHHTTVLA